MSIVFFIFFGREIDYDELRISKSDCII